MTPFECDLCVFVKLKRRYPLAASEMDRKLVACIRRVTLDAFWSRATSTVGNNLRSVRKIVNGSEQVELLGPFETLRPMPKHDHCGYQIAISMVLASTKRGKHSDQYTQFDTIRHLRSAFGTFNLISSQNAERNLTVSSTGIGSRDIVQNPTLSVWFRHFYSGCRSRMGQIYKPNLALTTEIITKMLRLIREDALKTQSRQVKFNVIIFGVYIAISYVLSLRGSEGLMLNLTTIVKEWNRYKDCIVISLKGKVKGESNVRDHVFPCCRRTSSGIDMCFWIRALILVHSKEDRKGGPGITTVDGDICSISHLDSVLHSYLIRLYNEGNEFPEEIKCEEDIRERFAVFRSLRRGSDTRALNQNIAANDIDVVNRWKAVESAKGKRPGQVMRQHYAEFAQLKEPFLRYTFAM